jgi:tetratricopeptide (TPR) repeat protein
MAAARVPESRRDHPNRIVDILKVATAILNGEIKYRRGEYASAFKHLREAIQHDDALLYTEPWGWMLPTRQAYAVLSLEQGNVEDAAKAYAEGLGLDPSLTCTHQHPNSVWALHGYDE